MCAVERSGMLRSANGVSFTDGFSLEFSRINPATIIYIDLFCLKLSVL